MAYLWLKALHIAAVVTWIGGMLVAAVVIAAFTGPRTMPDALAGSGMLDAVRRWDGRVTSPAMLLVWGLGLTLALQGGWFASPWLMLKLGLVLGLSALHGMLSGTLRRLGRTGARPAPPILRHAPAATVLCVLAIVVLVVIKPF